VRERFQGDTTHRSLTVAARKEHVGVGRDYEPRASASGCTVDTTHRSLTVAARKEHVGVGRDYEPGA
jgi:hypothetical protein